MDEIIWNSIISYLGKLKWDYMIALVIVAQVLTSDGIVNWMPFKWREAFLKIRRIWRVLFWGLVLMIGHYLIHDYYNLPRHGIAEIGWLINSLLFTIVVHKAVLQKLGLAVDTTIDNKVHKKE